MEYHLYPPFFVIAPESSFDKAWESFCADILNLTNGTREIRHRTPPDDGVDLFWSSQRTAYQCKAVLHGKAGDFPVSKSIASIKRALETRDKVGWDKYVLCVNIDPSGTQEEKLKSVYPEIEILTPSFWVPACHEFSDSMKERFRLLAPISEPRFERFIDETYVQEYADKLKSKLKEAPLMVKVYSNRRKEVFDIPVSREMTVDDLLSILIRMFRLPRRTSFPEDGCSVSLSYAIVINNQKTSLDKTFGDLNLNDGAVVTLHKTMIFRDDQGSSTEHVVEMITANSLSRRSRTKAERYESAKAKYTMLLDDAFEQALLRIVDDR